MNGQKLTRPWGPFITGLAITAVLSALGAAAGIWLPGWWAALSAVAYGLAAMFLAASIVGFVTDRHPRGR